MPEGDTLFRIATTLRPLLAGERVELAESPDRTLEVADLAGRTIESVVARGKHLLITFDDQRVLHSHLGMTGSWHAYRHEAPWQKPRHRAAVVLRVARCLAVCFSPKEISLRTATTQRRDAYLPRLGPDLMLADWDRPEAVRRMLCRASLPIGEAVMDQTLVAGIGNIYKSETLFLARQNPWTKVGAIGAEGVLAIIELASRLMRANRINRDRTTRHAADGGILWAYGRSGQPCYKCATTIRVRRQGDLGRTTYWCPQCQAPGGTDCRPR